MHMVVMVVVKRARFFQLGKFAVYHIALYAGNMIHKNYAV